MNSAQPCMNNALCLLKLKCVPKKKKKNKTKRGKCKTPDAGSSKSKHILSLNSLRHVILQIAISQKRDTPQIFIQMPKKNHSHKDLLILNLITKIRILININY